MKADAFFERVFVVSLAKRADRREQFTTSLRRAGFTWNVETFDAFNGSRLAVPSPFEGVPAAAFGCWLSHLYILTMAANKDWKNVLIFEDDALFTDDAAETLDAALDELPDDWDQFYLGFQPWNTKLVKPEVISPHVWRVGDANRTHAYAFNRRGYKTFLKHLYEWHKKPRGFHVDHWLGVLHRQLEPDGKHTVNVYAVRPQIVAQSDGYSDISNRNNYTNLWKVGETMETYKSPVNIVTSSVGYGKIGLHGSLGYENRTVNIKADSRTTWISAHAPSEIEIELEENALVFGALDNSGSPHVPVIAAVDDIPIGEVVKGGDKTPTVRLIPGKHILMFETDDARSAHTIWGIVKACDPVIEILSNSVCGRDCPGCNQQPFMTANPDYEYTAEDAAALVAALESRGLYRRVCFTGGEPALWSQLENVMEVFNTSKNITGSWVVTSCADEETIKRFKQHFGRVCVSLRNDTKAQRDAEYLRGCTIWDQTLHALPGTAKATSAVNCCCVEQGIEASLVGQKVYPCVLAASLKLSGKWDELAPVTIAEYLDSGKPRIGVFPACSECVNNLKYRNACEKAGT